MAGSERHPATAQLLRWFEFEHLPTDLQEVSAVFAAAAQATTQLCGDGPELSAGLRKLLEAKDCAVRQRIADRSETEHSDGPPTYGNPGGAAATVQRPPTYGAGRRGVATVPVPRCPEWVGPGSTPRDLCARPAGHLGPHS